MSFLEIFIVAVALAVDAFCTALGIGVGERFPGQSFRLSFHFGLFQAAMPILGWAVGIQVVEFVRAWDHWLAGGILSALALQLFWEALYAKAEHERTDPSRGLKLISLSVATSLDALAMGLVFAVVNAPILRACLLIGVVAGLATLAGLRLGRRLRRRFGRWLQVGGALLLLIVAYRLFQI